jgi:iturin family lipopeptide synthetase A
MNLLHTLIKEQAARRPGDDALAFEGNRLTYGELDRRADCLARRLRELGVGPDVLVGLYVHRSLDMIVAILGILNAGGAYVPIDPAHPRGRIAFLLDDANVGVLLTESTLVASLDHSVAQVVCVDRVDWSSEQPLPDRVRVDPAHLAYVIYTSGSTGRPKGVSVEHRNIVNYVRGVSERFAFEPGMHHATVSTIAADLGNTVIFPALATGGCLHIISRERAESQALFSEYCSRERIDVLKIVPSHLAALQTGRSPELVMPRRRLILGGEASRLDWIEDLRRLAPNCEIYNHYGPTETTVGVLTYHVDGNPAGTSSGTLPLGKPVPNTHVYILDSGGTAVPEGEEGELCVGGSGVARGYLNRPELTAEKFVTDPSCHEPPGRLYRTGDRARTLADGNIEFLGRLDDQIKLHGNRIEPGEIEATLRQVAGVRDAVVLAREDHSGRKQLIAYMTPERIDQPLWDKTVDILPDGSPVAHLNKNETDYIYNEIFVLQAYLRHGISVQDGDCIIDAGANIGLFTLFMSRLASDLRILSFEPNPAAYACLNANAIACGARVTCFPVGLSRDNTSAEMTFFEGLSLLSGFYADPATEREVVKHYVVNRHAKALGGERGMADMGELIDDRLRTTRVPAQLRTLSSVIAEERLDRIDLLKINVEKSEFDVLLGLAESDWPKIRQVVVEVDREQDLELVTGLLASHGFDVIVEQDELLAQTELRYVYATRTSGAPRSTLHHQIEAVHLRPLRPPVDGLLTPATLRAHLKAHLPHYMIPSAFVLVERIPLTTNGKIDRQALSTLPLEAKAAGAEDVTGPRTPTETTLAAIWSELLNLPRVGVNDDFFDLGGQSLVAIRAVARIRDAFHVNLSLRNLFERPTVAGLAELIDGLTWISEPRAPVDSGDREEIAL